MTPLDAAGAVTLVLLVLAGIGYGMWRGQLNRRG